jgi:hypothetical protein
MAAGIGFVFKLFSLIAPVKKLTKAGVSLGWSPAVRWFLHFAILGGILVALAWLSNRLFQKGGAWENQSLEHRGLPNWLYLPGLFMLFPYISGWLFYMIYRVASAEETIASYPEIDKAWSQACEALNKAGIQLADTPMFLVLGRPEAAENFFFEGAKLQLTVTQTPPEADAPLHVYANHEAIFVTCAGACLLGKHASIVALEGMTAQVAEAPAPMDALDADDGTVVPRGQGKRLANAVRMFATQGQLRPLQRRLIRNAAGKQTPNLLDDTAEVARLQNALGHLCRLIKADRAPQCPVNGMLVLLPLGSTDTDRDAKLTADILQRDMAVTRRIFQLRCPIFTIVCDMESIPGFLDFIRRQGKRFSRIGRSFPLASDLRGDALYQTLSAAIESYFVSGLRELLYPLFDVQTDGSGDAVNRNLYLLLDQMRERKDRLATIMSQGLRQPDDEPLLFGGCYLAATGTTEPEQAYVKGVLNRLYHVKEGTQDAVEWTAEAFRADESYHARANAGCFLLGLAVLGAIGAAVMYWRSLR